MRVLLSLKVFFGQGYNWQVVLSCNQVQSICIYTCVYIHVCIYVYIFIISSTVILAADWSIAVGYWIVFHCLSMNGNVRIRIHVSYPHSQIEAPTLNVISHSQIEAPKIQCFIPLSNWGSQNSNFFRKKKFKIFSKQKISIFFHKKKIKIFQKKKNSKIFQKKKFKFFLKNFCLKIKNKLKINK